MHVEQIYVIQLFYYAYVIRTVFRNNTQENHAPSEKQFFQRIKKSISIIFKRSQAFLFVLDLA